MGTVTINEVENLIEVRSEPHIYVFSTNTIPNYVKVGDTFRPISTRLGEWKEIYKDLQRLFPNINSEIEALAKVNDASILEYIKKQSDKGISSGLTGNMHKSDDKSNVDIPPADGDSGENAGEGETSSNNGNQNQDDNSSNNKEINELKEKYRKCVARLMFYTFLTKTNITALRDIVKSVEEPSKHQEDNVRIFNNLELELPFLKAHIKKCRRTFSFNIDKLLEQANLLSKDESLTKEEQVKNALARFSRISESEVVTPVNVCMKMLNTIGVDKLVEIVNSGGKILDISSKTGEFTFAIYALLKDKVDLDKLKKSLYAIATSSVTYEFTRHMYEILDLPLENLANSSVTESGLELSAYNLLKKTTLQGGMDYEKICRILTQKKPFNTITLNDEISEGEEKMKFEVVVGNPPYQSETKKDSENNGQKPRTNIFHHFQIQTEKLATQHTVLIFPGVRWIHQAGKGLKQFGKTLINSTQLNEIILYPNSKDVFESSDISDGISIVHTERAKNQEGFMYKYIKDGQSVFLKQDNPGNELLLINPKDATIAKKIKNYIKEHNLRFLHDSIFSRSLFGIESDFIEKNKTQAKKYDDNVTLLNDEIKILTNDKAGPAGRSCWFVIKKDLITSNVSFVDEWQVVVSSAHPGGQEGRDNQLAIIDNRSAFGRARVALKSFKTENEAKNFFKYLQCPFIKYAFLLSDESLSSLAKFVPDILDYSNENGILDFSKSVKDINNQLYQQYDLTKQEIDFIESLIKPMD